MEGWSYMWGTTHERATQRAQSVEGVMRGGVDGRLYTPQDAPLLREDLAGAKELFFSGGEGLPANQIDDVCKVWLWIQPPHMPLLVPLVS